tara:strand:+ start:7823 stop:10993 length:3171 start_codon:yes stop_codon:yes gene_type:complete
MATYADGLVAYYPGGQPYDLWDLFELSFSNVVPAAGQGPIKDAWEFTSNTGFMVPVAPIPNSTGVFTISLWFSQLAGGFRNAIAMAGNDSPIRIPSSGNDIGIRLGGTFYGCGHNPSGLVGSTAWYHLVAVSNGLGAIEYFLNGGSIGTATAPSPLVGDFTEIGNINPTGPRAFAQLLSETAFWNRALTAAEVNILYATNINKQSLRRLLEPGYALPSNKSNSEWIDMNSNAVLYHLDDVAAANIATDDSGNGRHGTGSNVTNISTTIKLHKGSLIPPGTIIASGSYYNGTNAYIDLNKTPGAMGVDGNNSRSMVFWASSSNWQNDKVLVTMGINSTGEDFSLVTKTTNRISLNTWGSDAFWNLPSSPLGWNHYGLTYDSASYAANFYFNGTSVGTWYFGSPRNTSNATNIRIGGPNYQWGYFTGGIQEFAIFSGSALSDAEILSVYNYQANTWAPLSGSATVSSIFGSVVHDGPPTINIDSIFGSVVHDGPPTINVDSLVGSVVHQGPSFNVADITGSVALTASFDAASQGLPSGSTAYQWSWASVPSGSAIANAKENLPNSGSTYPVSDNKILWHFDTQNTITTQVGSIGLRDTYGDGWHGNNFITVNVNGVPALTNITLAAGTGPEWFDFTAADGDNVEVLYTPGSFPSECFYTLNSGSAGTGTDFYTSPTNPVAPYTFVANGFLTASAFTTPDSSGQGNTGAVSTGSALVTDRYVGTHAYYFDGVSGSITGPKPSIIGIDGGNSRTIAFWASASAWVDYTTIFSMGTNTANQDFSFLQNAPSDLRLSNWTGGSDLIVTANSTTGWNHYFVIYDSSDVRSYIYQNNQLLGTKTQIQNTSDLANLTVGKGVAGWVAAPKFSGSIDEFAVWNRALTSCERDTIYGFLQTGSIKAAQGSSPNLLEQFSFVPDTTGSYIINLEIVDHSNCASITGSVTASIGPTPPTDCAGVIGGSAYINSCGWCVGGTTGRHITYGQTTCPDGSTICSSSSGGVPTGSCSGVIISGSGEELLVTSKYDLQYSKKASEQRFRRVAQIPFALSSKSFLSIRKKSDDEF